MTKKMRENFILEQKLINIAAASEFCQFSLSCYIYIYIDLTKKKDNKT